MHRPPVKVEGLVPGEMAARLSSRPAAALLEAPRWQAYHRHSERQ
jgi:hypothetical protein